MTDNEATEYELLLLTREELTNNIASMVAQLETRHDQPWRNHCIFNLSKKRMTLKDLNRKINYIDSARAHEAKIESAKERQRAHWAGLELQKKQRAAKDGKLISGKLTRNQRNAMLRMKTENTLEALIHQKFKAIIKKELGPERYVPLIQQAAEEAEREMEELRRQAGIETEPQLTT